MSNTSDTKVMKADVLLKTPLKNPSLISSAYGPLKHILYSYPFYEPGVELYKRIFRDLFQKLPQYTNFSIWVHTDDRIQKDLEGLLKDENISYAYAGKETKLLGRHESAPRAMLLRESVVRQFAVWAQDPFLVVRDKEEKGKDSVYLVEPKSFFDIGDADKFGSDLAKLAGIQKLSSPVNFHGGNTLVGDDFILLGKADFRLTLNSLKHDNKMNEAANFTGRMYKKHLDADRRLILISSEQDDEFGKMDFNPVNQNAKSLAQLKGLDQPQPHIDLFVSIAGKNKNGKQIILVGDPVSLKPVDKFTAAARAKQYNKISENLKAQGFEVIRNPMPKVQAANGLVFDYHAYYNNCLVQVDAKLGNKVWLPQYGSDLNPAIRQFDQENQNIWKDMGFDVIPLTDYNELSSYKGAVHCISKDLER